MIQMVMLIVLSLVMLSSTVVLADDELIRRHLDPGILPVDDAFRFDAVRIDGGYSVFWQVAPGYFLYRDKFEFRVGDTTASVSMPGGAWYQDETFGRVQVLDGLVEIEFEAGDEKVSVHYQGCATQGFCYPPQKKQLNSGK